MTYGMKTSFITVLLVLLASTVHAKPMGTAENPFGWSAGDGTSLQQESAPQSKKPSSTNKSAPQGMQCGIKKTYKQMKSCAEVNFYFHNCEHKQMDGDGDGFACEQEVPLCRI